MQPRSHLACGKVDIRLGPFARPSVLGAVKLRAAHPVGQRQIAAVADAHAPLFGGVDHEEPTKGPERLTPQPAARFLIDDDHPLATVPQLGGSGQSGQPCAHNDGVCLFHDVLP